MEAIMYQELIKRLDSLQDGMCGLKSDVSELKSDVSGLKSDVSGLKSDVSGLKSDVSELKAKVTRIEQKQDAVIVETVGLLEFRTETLSRLSELQINQKSISAILGEHEVQIRSLQRRPV